MDISLVLRQGMDAANEKQGTALANACPYKQGDPKEALWMLGFAEKSSHPDLTHRELVRRYKEAHITRQAL